MLKHKQLGLAAVLVPLFCASPGGAQQLVNNSSDHNIARLGPSYVPSSDLTKEFASPGGGLFPDHASGVSASRLPLVSDDGSKAVRRGIIGSWQIAKDTNIGVGLLSVTGASTKERDFRRSQPVRDTGVHDKRIAAVGLSFRF